MRYERLKELEAYSRAKYPRNKESLVESPELSEDDDKKLDLIWKEVAQKNGYKNVDVTTPKIEKLVNSIYLHTALETAIFGSFIVIYLFFQLRKRQISIIREEMENIGLRNKEIEVLPDKQTKHY